MGRAGKNLDPDRFESGQIEHSDKNFIPGPCPDYKSNTLTRLAADPNVQCPEPVGRVSEFVL